MCVQRRHQRAFDDAWGPSQVHQPRRRDRGARMALFWAAVGHHACRGGRGAARGSGVSRRGMRVYPDGSARLWTVEVKSHRCGLAQGHTRSSASPPRQARLRVATPPSVAKRFPCGPAACASSSRQSPPIAGARRPGALVPPVMTNVDREAAPDADAQQTLAHPRR